MGQFFGFSDEHYTLVENVSNFSTGYISTHFHLVFGDIFETVISSRDDGSVFNAICNDIFDLNRDWYTDDEHDDTGNLIYRPTPIENVWIDKKCHCDTRHELKNKHRCREDGIHNKNSAVPDIIPLNTKNNKDRSPMGAPVSEDESSVESFLGYQPTKPEGEFSLIMLMMSSLITHILILIFHHRHSLHF